jgi:hypothetical protein
MYVNSTRHWIKKKFPPGNALAPEARALQLVIIGAYNIRSMRYLRQETPLFFVVGQHVLLRRRE